MVDPEIGAARALDVVSRIVREARMEQDADGVDVLGAEVLWVDHFGNVQLNVDPDELDGWGDRIQLRIGTNVRTATRITAFGQLTTGEIGLLVDADGLVAVVTDRHPAAEELGLATGDDNNRGNGHCHNNDYGPAWPVAPSATAAESALWSVGGSDVAVPRRGDGRPHTWLTSL